MIFYIMLRSFAPFRDFGGGFQGDERDFSADVNASSRIASMFKVDLEQQRTWDVSGAGGSGSGWPYWDRQPWFRSNSHNRHQIGATFDQMAARLEVSHAGANSLMPGSPDIDRKAVVTVRRHHFDHRDCDWLSVSANLRGDIFPEAELILLDESHTAAFVTAYGTHLNTLGPLFFLFGDQNVALGSGQFEMRLNAGGQFEQLVNGTLLSDHNSAVIRRVVENRDRRIRRANQLGRNPLAR